MSLIDINRLVQIYGRKIKSLINDPFSALLLLISNQASTQVILDNWKQKMFILKCKPILFDENKSLNNRDIKISTFQ